MQRVGGGQLSTAPPTAGQPVLRGFLAWCLVGATVVLAVAASLILLPGTARGTFADVINVPTAGAATVACARAARRPLPGRLAWTLLTATCLSWTVGELFWAIGSFEGPLATGADGSGVADVFYLLGLPLGIAALACFAGPRAQGTVRLGSVLDGLVFGAATVFIFRTLGLLEPGLGSRATQVINLAYPVGDLVMLTMAATLLSRARAVAISTVSTVLVTTAIGCYVVGDTGYALAAAAGTYEPGTLLDLTWPASYLVFALAALAPMSPPGRENDPADYRLPWLPWTILCVAMGTAVIVATVTPRPLLGDAVTIGAGFFALLAFAVRQAGLVYDFSRVNRALAGQVHRTSQITQSVLDGVLVTDTRGRVRFLNEAAAALLGGPVSQLTGSRVLDLLADPATPADDPIVVALTEGRALTQVSTLFRRLDGTELPVELTIGPVRNPGRHSRVVVVFRDITARQELDRVKREFLSVVSHELRTPLASIRGALALLEGGVAGALAPDGARMVNIALLSSERLSRLLDDLLDLERLTTGRAQFNPAALRVRDLIEIASNEMSGLAVHQGVELVVGRAEGVVWADPDRMVQLLANLLHNAVKFSAPGRAVTVSASISDDFVELSVADQGRGIPPDQLERIFDPFVQVDSSDSRQINGTGLGLAICRDLVQQHGGRIWVVSTPGEGSDFRFTLPSAPSEAAPPAPRSTASAHARNPVGVSPAQAAPTLDGVPGASTKLALCPSPSRN